jgi:hypothetical protein
VVQTEADGKIFLVAFPARAHFWAIVLLVIMLYSRIFEFCTTAEPVTAAMPATASATASATTADPGAEPKTKLGVDIPYLVMNVSKCLDPKTLTDIFTVLAVYYAAFYARQSLVVNSRNALKLSERYNSKEMTDARAVIRDAFQNAKQQVKISDPTLSDADAAAIAANKLSLQLLLHGSPLKSPANTILDYFEDVWAAIEAGIADSNTLKSIMDETLDHYNDIFGSYIASQGNAIYDSVGKLLKEWKTP